MPKTLKGALCLRNSFSAKNQRGPFVFSLKKPLAFPIPLQAAQVLVQREIRTHVHHAEELTDHVEKLTLISRPSGLQSGISIAVKMELTAGEK